VLRTDLALTQLVRSSADDGDTAAEQTAMATLALDQLAANQRARERADRVRAAKVSADGIRDALKAGRAIFARDKSAKTRRLRSQLATRLSSFRAAQRKATGVPGLILDQAILDRVKKTTPIAFPNPEPPQPPRTPIPITQQPAPPGLQVSTLTLTCPGNGKPGVYAAGGTLSPVITGVDIQLHVTPPNGPETVLKATTNGSGGYSTGVVMQTTGTWTMFARFGGDAKTQPDDSPSCQTVISP
jgi:hypothetical protein